MSAIVITGKKEIDGTALLSISDVTTLNLKNNNIAKAFSYDIVFFGEKARLEVATLILNESNIAALYKLVYSKGVITSAAIYKIINKTIYLNKFTINGKNKILVSCANECSSDGDCAPPDPDCVNYCCSWNVNCLRDCCGVRYPWNPCYIPCTLYPNMTACLACLLVVCGLICLQYTCCTRYHKICAGHG